MGCFLFFGAAMASLAGTTLVWRGTFLDRIWVLNARAYKHLAPYGNAAGLAFLLLGATLAAAGVGWLRRRFWGWGLTVAIITTQLIGNLVNAVMGAFLKGGMGMILAGALLYFLFRPWVRAAFARGICAGMH